jgi:methyl-accepting chemotaxis protein PixJ
MMPSETISTSQSKGESLTQTPLPRSFVARVQSVLKTQLLEVITVSLLLSVAMTGTSAWNVWRIYQGLQTTIDKQFKLQDLSGQVIHLDEVLTMSARMAASTGDRKWEERYNKFVPQLDEAIKGVLKDVPTAMQVDPERTDIANKKLVDLETQSFTLNRQGKSKAALSLLLGAEYEQQKAIYSDGINGTLSAVKRSIEMQRHCY